MTATTIAIAAGCQIPLVAGQLFLKHAMGAPSAAASKRAANFIGGVACLTLWFFLWLGLLETQELSRVFPFEGLNPALMVFAAWIFLKERIPPAAWIGVALICVGIALVSGT